ncbi:MAG: CCA tRNA nucleotidyltransferase [Bacillota bacterium]
MEAIFTTMDLMRLLQGTGQYLCHLGTLADRRGWDLFLVGGCVRDLLLGVPSLDLDLVVEGEGIVLAEEAAALLDARLKTHQRFGTATLTLKDGCKLDIATARKEYYQHPGALPIVEASTLQEDLHRRDFTINAMAVQLNEKCFGQLIDYFSGAEDLKKGQIRVMHHMSFVDDPTRILRAIRFEQRYAFSMDSDTFDLASIAISDGMLGMVSGPRLGQELRLILQDKNVTGAILRMEDLGVWEKAYPVLRPGVVEWPALNRVHDILEKASKKPWAEGLRPWLVYLGILLHGIDSEDINEIGLQFGWSKRDIFAVGAAVAQIDQVEAAFKPEIPRLGYLHQMLEPLPPESILIIIALTAVKPIEQILWTYLERRHRLHLLTKGEDLMSLGLQPGPIFSEVVQALRRALLEGEVHNLSEELDFARRWLSAKGVNLDVRQ